MSLTLRHKAFHRVHGTHLFLNSAITVVNYSFSRAPGLSVLTGRLDLVMLKGSQLQGAMILLHVSQATVSKDAPKPGGRKRED